MLWMSSKFRKGGAVKVREVSVAEPSVRLERLLSRFLLDDAEKFAMEHGLDVQVVENQFFDFLEGSHLPDESASSRSGRSDR